MAEDLQAKAGDMMKSLQQQWDDTFAGKQDAFKNLTESAKKNMEIMKKHAAEGKDTALKDLKKANDDMLDKMKKLQDEIKGKMNTEYKKLIPDDEAVQKNWDTVKKQMQESFQKVVVDKDSPQYKEAMDKLQKFQGKTKKEADALYDDLSKRLDTMYNDSVKQLKY